jgi:hypothetical protein
MRVYCMRAVKIVFAFVIALIHVCSASAQTAGDRFGEGVALAGDFAFIGAPYEESESGAANTGFVYVYKKGHSGWALTQRLESDRLSGRFGEALAAEGGRLVVAEPGHGRIHVFQYVDFTWQIDARLTARANGADLGRLERASVALAGDLIAMGAPTFGSSGIEHGTVVLWKKAGFWTEVGRLEPFDLLTVQWFGWDVALSGSSLVVGAPGTSRHGTFAGDAYLYFVNATNTLVFVTALNTAMGGSLAFDNFGTSVAMRDKTVLVGAPGAMGNGQAEVFIPISNDTTSTSDDWTSVAILESGVAPSKFGAELALAPVPSSSLFTAVVGAPSTDTGIGAAFVFQGSSGVWLLRQMITSDATGTGGRFGSALATNTSRIVIGAPFTNTSVGLDVGIAELWATDSPASGPWRRDAGIDSGMPIQPTKPQLTDLDPMAGLEDQSLLQAFMSVSDSDTRLSDLDFTATSSNQAILRDSDLRVKQGFGLVWLEARSQPNAFGEAVVTVDVTDGETTSRAQTLATISAVNDAPTLVMMPGTDRVHDVRLRTAFTVDGFAAFQPGGEPFESNQTVLAYLLDVVSDPNDVVGPFSLSDSGTLRYELTGRRGSATMSVRVKDSGGVTNGGKNLSELATFRINNGMVFADSFEADDTTAGEYDIDDHSTDERQVVSSGRRTHDLRFGGSRDGPHLTR